MVEQDPDLALIKVSNAAWDRYDQYVRGRSPRAIAAEYGMTIPAVQAELKAVTRAIPQEALDDVRRKHLEELAAMTSGMWELFHKKGAPVTSGKDGDVVYDPEDNEIVRDYALRLSATDKILKIQERAAKLLGLDSAVKVDVAVTSSSVDADLQELAEQLGLNKVQAESQRVGELDAGDTSVDG
jgi:hypothetical protein